MEAIMVGGNLGEGVGESAWMTSWMSVRGCWVRRSEGVRAARIEEESDFDSVPGTLVSGRTVTSNVAREACSAAKRTSMGPDTEARAFVCPNRNNVAVSNQKQSWGL